MAYLMTMVLLGYGYFEVAAEEGENAIVTENVTVQEDTSVTSDYANIWRSGCYVMENGKYVSWEGRICHVDCTWDDSRTGTVFHKYMLRNDSEYLTLERVHKGFKGTISTSTAFTNWDIHNIVGELKRDSDGWYYMKSGQKIYVQVE